MVNPARETRATYDLIYNNEVLYFQSSNFVHAYEALAGNELWRTSVGSPPLLSGMILIGNRLYTANEDRYLYCLDAQTGAIAWKQLNTGTCSELTYLNGVLYYLGGGDGLLHAVNAQTGKHIWKLSSPDLQANPGARFFGTCVAVRGHQGKKGVVIATTGINAYGFEAAE